MVFQEGLHVHIYNTLKHIDIYVWIDIYDTYIYIYIDLQPGFFNISWWKPLRFGLLAPAAVAPITGCPICCCLGPNPTDRRRQKYVSLDVGKDMGFLGGGNSKIFYFHPDPWGNDPIWLIFFKGVETNHQLGFLGHEYCIYFGQIIATSHDRLAPKRQRFWFREMGPRKFQGNHRERWNMIPFGQILLAFCSNFKHWNVSWTQCFGVSDFCLVLSKFGVGKVADLSPKKAPKTFSETNNPPQMVFLYGSKYWWVKPGFGGFDEPGQIYNPGVQWVQES